MRKSSVKAVPVVLSLSAAVICGTAMRVSAAVLFEDNFENDLSLWTGQDGGSHSGVIVDDPLRPENKVLTFTQLASGGDVFTTQQFNLVPGERYQVSFEYLGLEMPGSVPGALGGFAGLSEEFPGRHLWYYSTTGGSLSQDVLIDDGQWHSYIYEFTAPITFRSSNPSGTTSNLIRLMFEDVNNGDIPGDVFFDKIRLEQSSEVVPEPLTILGTGLALTFGALFKSKQRNFT